MTVSHRSFAQQSPQATPDQIQALSSDCKRIIGLLQKEIDDGLTTVKIKKILIDKYIADAERKAWDKTADHLIEAGISFLAATVAEGPERGKLLKEAGESLLKFSPYLALRFAADQARRTAFAELDSAVRRISADSDDLQAKRVELAGLDERARQAGLLPPAVPPPVIDRSELGAWTLDLGSTPSARLDFNKAVMPGSNASTFRDLALSCGPNNSLLYQLTSINRATDNFFIIEGEDSTSIKLGLNGYLSSSDAVRFATRILAEIKIYKEHNENQQYISVLTPDMHGDDVNVRGFETARSTLKAACAKLSPSQRAAVAPSQPIATGKAQEVSRWRDVISLVANLNKSGACRIPPFSPAAIMGLAKVREISCGNGAGTRLSGQNGIDVFFHSVEDAQTARVDDPIDVMKLSSITIQIPSNLYTHVPPGSILSALHSILGPAGLGKYADSAAASLQKGQNSVEYLPHYAVSSFSNGAGVNSAQVFGYVIIIKCGRYEAPYAICRR